MVVEYQNVAAELRRLVERQFSYMPTIARQEMQREILSRINNWLLIYKTHNRKKENKGSDCERQILDIESFLNCGVDGVTGCLRMYDEKLDIEDILNTGKDDGKKISHRI